jgi:hypothetical protein
MSLGGCQSRRRLQDIEAFPATGGLDGIFVDVSRIGDTRDSRGQEQTKPDCAGGRQNQGRFNAHH